MGLEIILDIEIYAMLHCASLGSVSRCGFFHDARTKILVHIVVDVRHTSCKCNYERGRRDAMRQRVDSVISERHRVLKSPMNGSTLAMGACENL